MYKAFVSLAFDARTDTVVGAYRATGPDYESCFPIIMGHMGESHADHFLADMVSVHGEHEFSSEENYWEFAEKFQKAMMAAQAHAFELRKILH